MQTAPVFTCTILSFFARWKWLSENKSDLKPCDLEKNVFDDGPLGLKAIIEDEVGATVNEA